MAQTLEVLALDCTEPTTHVVHLAVEASASECPLSLIEQRSFQEQTEFVKYWLQLLQEGRPLQIVAEDHPNDPHNLLEFVEQRYPVDRHFLHFRDVAYKQPLHRLGITLVCARAGSLALNKAYQVMASKASERLMAATIELSRRLQEVEMEACRLHLALNSSIYSLSINF